MFVKTYQFEQLNTSSAIEKSKASDLNIVANLLVIERETVFVYCQTSKIQKKKDLAQKRMRIECAKHPKAIRGINLTLKLLTQQVSLVSLKVTWSKTSQNGPYQNGLHKMNHLNSFFCRG
nr:ORF48 [Bracoviriform inaniti]